MEVYLIQIDLFSFIILSQHQSSFNYSHGCGHFWLSILTFKDEKGCSFCFLVIATRTRRWVILVPPDSKLKSRTNPPFKRKSTKSVNEARRERFVEFLNSSKVMVRTKNSSHVELPKGVKIRMTLVRERKKKM